MKRGWLAALALALVVPTLSVAAGTRPATGSKVSGGGPAGIHLRSSAEGNEVIVDVDPASNRYLVSDTLGVVGCQPIRFDLVSCPGPQVGHAHGDTISPSALSHYLDTGGGRDLVELEAIVPGEVWINAGDDSDLIVRRPGTADRIHVDSGGGSDVVTAAGGADLLSGARGDDLLVGRGNQDAIEGGRGFDALMGGTGNDVLNAVDRHRDDYVRCGPGEDLARVDPEDPAPVDCEHVRFVGRED